MSITSINQTNLDILQKQTHFKSTRLNLNKPPPQQVATEINFSKDGKSLDLVYQAALEKLNEVLLPVLGENALQKAYDNGLDVSPEATAERIVSGATGLLGRFLNANEDKTLGDNFANFMDIIRGGIEQGFNEARDILASLQVLQGDIASNVDRTYELVQQGLGNFETDFRDSQGIEKQQE